MRIKYAIIITALAWLSTIKAQALDFRVGYLYYTTTSSDEVEVAPNPNGDYNDVSIIPATVTYKGKEYRVTGIGDLAFANNYSLKAVQIQADIKRIGDWAFFQCSEMEGIILPSTLETIGMNAFSYCNSFESIHIPGSVVSIGKEAFSHCSLLCDVIIDEGLTEIPEGCFEWNTTLYDVSIPSTVKTIGVQAFSNCYNLISLTLPEGVTTIEEWAFDNCQMLHNVTLPESLNSIGSNAFLSCLSIPFFRIPDGVTRIDDEAFNNCQELTRITMGRSLVSIGKRAFCDCNNLDAILMYTETPPTISDDSFEKICYNGAELYVSDESKESYMSAVGWKNFSRIVSYDPEGVGHATVDRDVERQSYSIDGRVVGNGWRGIVIEITKGKPSKKRIVK